MPATRRTLDPQTVLARAMTEGELLINVLDAAKQFHWRRAHFRAAMTTRGWRTPVQGDGKGFPDLILLRRGRLIVAELKSETAPEPKDEQDAWLSAFEWVPWVEVAVWRPSHWLSGEIETALA